MTQFLAGAVWLSLPGTDTVFRVEVAWTEGWRNFSTFNSAFFPHIFPHSIQRHCLLPLCVVWSCNLALWVEVSILIWAVFRIRICSVVQLWTLSKCHIPVPRCRLVLTHSRWFASVAALLLPQLVDQVRKETVSPVRLCNFHIDRWVELWYNIHGLKRWCEWGSRRCRGEPSLHRYCRNSLWKGLLDNRRTYGGKHPYVHFWFCLPS